MKGFDKIVRYLLDDRQNTYSKILKIYKTKEEEKDARGVIQYIDSLYRLHLRARINVETAQIVGPELQHQINIQENNLEFMNIALKELLSAENASKVMNLYKHLSQRDVELHKVRNLSYFKRLKMAKQIRREMKSAESMSK